MKKVFFLSVLFIPISLLLSQSNSFSNATLKNETTLAIVSEDSALVGIGFGEGKSVLVTNNMEQSIEIVNIGITDGDNNLYGNVEVLDSFITPGETREFFFTQNSEDLLEKYIQLMAKWEGGSVEVKSQLPIFFEEVPAVNEEKLDGKTLEEDTIKPVIEDELLPELIEVITVPEPIITEKIDDIIKTEPVQGENMPTESIGETIIFEPEPETETDKN